VAGEMCFMAAGFTREMITCDPGTAARPGWHGA
jgi:hypothetical protein